MKLKKIISLVVTFAMCCSLSVVLPTSAGATSSVAGATVVGEWSGEENLTTNVGMSGSYQMVENTEGGYMMYFDGTKESSAYVNVSAYDKPVVEFEARVKFADAQMDNLAWWIYTDKNNTANNVRFQIYNKTFNVGGSSNYGVALEENTWYNTRIVFDAANNRQDIFVNGALIRSGYIRSGATFTSPKTVETHLFANRGKMWVSRLKATVYDVAPYVISHGSQDITTNSGAVDLSTALPLQLSPGATYSGYSTTHTTTSDATAQKYVGDKFVPLTKGNQCNIFVDQSKTVTDAPVELAYDFYVKDLPAAIPDNTQTEIISHNGGTWSTLFALAKKTVGGKVYLSPVGGTGETANMLIEPNKWHRMYIWCDTAQTRAFKVYVDGLLVKTGTYATASTGTTRIQFKSQQGCAMTISSDGTITANANRNYTTYLDNILSTKGTYAIDDVPTAVSNTESVLVDGSSVLVDKNATVGDVKAALNHYNKTRVAIYSNNQYLAQPADSDVVAAGSIVVVKDASCEIAKTYTVECLEPVVIVDDDFEGWNDTLYNKSSNAQNGWVFAANTGNGTLQAVKEGENQVLKLTSNGEGNDFAYVSKAISSGVVVMSGKVKYEGADNKVCLTVRHNSPTGGQFFEALLYENHTTARKGKVMVAGNPYDINQADWNDFTTILNYSTGTADFYVNGQLIAADSPISNGLKTMTSTDTFRLQLQSWNLGTASQPEYEEVAAYFDDIKIVQYPVALFDYSEVSNSVSTALSSNSDTVVIGDQLPMPTITYKGLSTDLTGFENSILAPANASVELIADTDLANDAYVKVTAADGKTTATYKVDFQGYYPSPEYAYSVKDYGTIEKNEVPVGIYYSLLVNKVGESLTLGVADNDFTITGLGAFDVATTLTYAILGNIELENEVSVSSGDIVYEQN